MLAVEAGGRSFLIDCGGDVIQRALQSGLDLAGIDGMLITHEHPDHVSGFPLFMERLWLAGRTRPISIFGIRTALRQARKVLFAFDIGGWDLPRIDWCEIPHEANVPVLISDTWRITGAPGIHSVPVMGFRFDHLPSGSSVTYSADTEPSSAIVDLARGGRLLIHEATGETRGHTSVGQAIELAQDAGVAELVLVHLSVGTSEMDLGPLAVPRLEVSFADELDIVRF